MRRFSPFDNDPSNYGDENEDIDFGDFANTEGIYMTEYQIKHMVDRFLSWKLPENFNPDNGISFNPVMNKGYEFESRREPVGTNLLDADQAEAMVRYLVEGLPPSPQDAF